MCPPRPRSQQRRIPTESTVTRRRKKRQHIPQARQARPNQKDPSTLSQCTKCSTKTRIATREGRGKRTHSKHDKLLSSFPFNARHHPANLIALGALLPARRARRQLTLEFFKHKLGLDANTTPALERLETQQPMACQCELAHFRLAL